jgi:hypothetical protein
MEDLDENTPIPVGVAAKVCFPFGGLTKSTLMYAIRAGKLAYEKNGRAYFVTGRDFKAGQ